MLQNAYLLAKIGADTAENEQHFAENLPKICNYPTGVVAVNRVAPRRVAPRVPGRLYRGLHRALREQFQAHRYVLPAVYLTREAPAPCSTVSG